MSHKSGPKIQRQQNNVFDLKEDIEENLKNKKKS